MNAVHPQTGKTALHFLIEDYYYNNDFSDSSFLKYLKEFLDCAFQRNLDLEIQDNNGFTPLMLACKKDKPYFVKILLEKGSTSFY